MTTEMLMTHAISRGLLLRDFNMLSIGMILDYIAQYDVLRGNKAEGEEEIKQATQEHFNNF
ncbi:MAG TPA: hypothetical protein GX707_21325 [Epulopiscium sp.]|nr:hypothetical protein [Candidatus Epulonipiscium sp.]